MRLLLTHFHLRLSSVAAPPRSSECLALLSVKSAVTDDPQSFLTSWNTAANCCTWRGVTCDSSGEHVTALDVSGLGLVGALSPDVGQLRFLVNFSTLVMFLQSEELTSFLDEAVAASAYYDLSSPDGPHSSKNIVSERNRRKKLNERLYALRAVIPNITKMDKASIVKDAIEHIKSLHDEESRIEAEIAELETGRASPSDGDIFCCDDQLPERTMKRARLTIP